MFSKLISLLLLFCVGCASMGARSGKSSARDTQKNAKDQTEFFSPEDNKENQNIKGSLWTSSYYSRLYDNMYRAAKVGDNLMIIISEEAEGEGEGNTKSDRKHEQSNSIASLGGVMQKLQGLITGLDPSNLLQATSDSKFQGKATTERSGKLFAQISATVTEVLRNGNFAVRGEKRIKLNKEEQVIIVEGVVRPYDIEPNNTIMSTALADARITYSGFGVIAGRQSPGWLARMLDYVWPF